MRKLLLRAGSVAAALVVGIAVAEAAVRWSGLAAPSGVVTVDADDFARLPGIFAPHQRVTQRSNPALPHRVTTNALGFRGRDFPLAKAPREFRVLFVGDSNIYGDFVDDDQTLPAQLEAAFQGRCENISVVNAGLPGATITEEKEIARRALALNPDLVVLAPSENDLTDLLFEPSLWEQLAANRRVKSRFPMSLAYPVFRRTALWELALRARARWRGAAVTSAVEARRASGTDSSSSRSRARYVGELRLLRDMLADQHVRLALAVFPFYQSLPKQSPELVSWFVETGRSLGLPTFSLLVPFQVSGLPATSLYLLPYDGHARPVAYSMAAAYLVDRLAALPDLSSRCRGAADGQSSDRLSHATAIIPRPDAGR